MGLFSAEEARGLFTKQFIAKFKDKPNPTAFLRSLFPTKESSALNISVEVMRGFEKIAVDIERGSRGNGNKFSKSTERLYQPPLFREYFNAVDLDFYDRLFTRSEKVDMDPISFREWLDTVIEKMVILRNKIERAYEVQCSQVLDDGIVTLTSGDNVDFKRKTASKIVISTKWDVSTNPIADLITGCKFIREEGLFSGPTITGIFGEDALEALINNSAFQARADIKDYDLGLIREPQRNSLGASLHGRLTAGSYKINIWTYPQVYTNSGGVATPYIDPKKVILVPEIPNFVFGFAGVPTSMATGSTNIPTTIAPARGAFHVGEYLDTRKATHEFDIQSAGLAIPVAVDQLYTMQVLS